MAKEHTSNLPLSTWIRGFQFKTKDALSVADRRLSYFRCSGMPGVITAGTISKWSLSLGIEEDLDNRKFLFLSEGFTYVATSDRYTALCITPEPGLCVGMLFAPCSPSLFSSTITVHTDKHTQWLTDDDLSIALSTNPSSNAIHFAMAISTKDLDDAMNKAEQGLEYNATDLFDKIITRRHSHWQTRPPGEQECDLWCHSYEDLIGRYCKPMAKCSGLWLNTGTIEQPVFSINETYAVFPALCRIEPDSACEIMQSILGLQNKKGAIPAAYFPCDNQTSQLSAWPMASQCCLMLSQAERTVPESILKQLERNLTYTLRHYGATEQSQPHWASADEALIKEAWESTCITPDIVGLLITEIEAFLELVHTHDYDCNTQPFEVAKKSLIQTLESQLWDPGTLIFRGHSSQGNDSTKRTAATLIPFLWHELPNQYRQALISRLLSPGSFGSPWGIPGEEPDEQDIDMMPVSSLYQCILLPCLDHHAFQSVAPGIHAAIAHALLTCKNHHHWLNVELNPHLSPASTPGKSACTASALPLLISWTQVDEERHRTAQQQHPIITRMERRRSLLGSALTAGVIIFMCALSFFYLNKTSMTGSTIQALTAMAKHYEAQNNYTEAAAIYKQLMSGTQNNPQYEMLLANALYKSKCYEEAEMHYRNLIDKPKIAPVVLMNLGLILFQQQRYEEAIDMYKEFQSTYGDKIPSLAARAEIALELTKEQAYFNSLTSDQ